MAHGTRKTVTITTAADGSATEYLEAGTWYVDRISYIKTDFADGVDFAITGADSGENIWTESDVNAAKTVRPRAATHSNAGVASNYAATFPVNDKILIVEERIKIVIASGGNAKTGAFEFVMEQ